MATQPLNPFEAARLLGVSTHASSRLAAMPSPADLTLPDDNVASDLLEFCSVNKADRQAMLQARPDPERDPAHWWLLSATVAELHSRMDQPLPPHGYVAWPTLPSSSGPVGMFVYAWALLAIVPELVAVHRRRGVAETITRESLNDLGGVMKSHFEVTGHRGVGLFPLWGPPQSFCGADLQLGRLSYTRAQVAFGDGPAGWVLQVHIPPYGPLNTDEANASLDRALTFFPKHFPDEPVAAMVCISWMMDPQLQEYLPETSNLLAFQKRFRTIPLPARADVWEDDREMMRLALQLPTPDAGPLHEEHLARVPRDTSLQRAFVDHIRAGRHWHKPTGLLPVSTHHSDRSER